MPKKETSIDLPNYTTNEKSLIILSRSLPFHSLGGMEALAWDLARQLAAKGINIRILTTRIPSRQDRFVIDNIEVIALQNTVPGRYSISWWKESRKYFKKYFMDSTAVILSVSAAAYGLLSLKRDLHGIPLIYQAHGTNFGEAVSKWRTRRLFPIITSLRNIYRFIKDLTFFPRFDAFVAVGDPVMVDLCRPPVSWVLPPSKVHLIRNGIDTERFYPNAVIRNKMRAKFGWSEDYKVIISVSRFHSQKGLDLSLRGFAEFTKVNPFARYVIIGDGPEWNNLIKLAAALNISDKVVFTGAIQRLNVIDYLRMGDIFLFTTRRVEGLPLNVLEALATGIPAIVSKHLSELVKEIPATCGVDPFNENNIAEALNSLANSPKGMASLLPEEFSLKYCADQYCRLFQNLQAK